MGDAEDGTKRNAYPFVLFHWHKFPISRVEVVKDLENVLSQSLVMLI